MPIEQLTAKLYKFTLNRNQHTDTRVKLDNLKAVGKYYGFSEQEVGYAIQLLKRKDMLRYYRKSGWVAIAI